MDCKNGSQFLMNHALLGGTNHWVCSCSLGSGVVLLFDSLGLFMTMNDQLLLQIAKIYSAPPDQDTLKVQKMSVQQQKGVIDCGLFAIAFAVEVCLGKNPEYFQFDQPKMRTHLYNCLTEGKMIQFPKVNGPESLPRPGRTVYNIKLYCYCRMPEEFDSNMVQCDFCHCWYHFRCVGKSNALQRIWKCHYCISHSD